MDCAVAALAMLLGTSYEEALMAFHHNAIARGATIRQIQRAAGVLGYKLTWTRRVNIETDAGLLMLSSSQWPSDHIAILKDELIIDTDATIWDADVYLAVYQARPLSLLTIAPSR